MKKNPIKKLVDITLGLSRSIDSDKIPFVQPTFEDVIPVKKSRCYLCIDVPREKTWREDDE